MRDGLVGERLVDRFSLPFLREIEQELRNPARDIQQREAVDLRVGAAQPSSQLGEERPGDGGIGLYAATEIVLRGPDEFRKVIADSMVQNAAVVKAVGLTAN